MYLMVLLAGVSILSTAAAQVQNPAPAPPAPEFTTAATVKDIMVSIVDPSADALWDSVATTVTAAGVAIKQPQTDKEWAEIRSKALMLVEATNLLMIPGRRIAKPGEKSGNPGVELPPEQIEILVNQDRDTWNKRSRGLYDAALVALKAVDDKNAAGLLAAGAAIDRACENCHVKYWYPKK